MIAILLTRILHHPSNILIFNLSLAKLFVSINTDLFHILGKVKLFLVLLSFKF